MSLSYRYDQDAAEGGLDIVISLSHREADVLGADAALLLDWTDTALWALALLRTGQNLRAEGGPAPVSTGDWYYAINDLEHRIAPRLEGIVDAAIRTHRAQGGTVDELALAMDAPRSTAQYRRKRVTDRFPNGWETWAVSGGPDSNRAPDEANPAKNPPLPSHRAEVVATAAQDGRLGAVCACGWTSPARTTNTVEAALWGQAHADQANATAPAPS